MQVPIFDISFSSTPSWGKKSLTVGHERQSRLCMELFFKLKVKIEASEDKVTQRFKAAHGVKCICCNNAGESKAFKSLCKQKEIGLTFGCPVHCCRTVTLNRNS